MPKLDFHPPAIGPKSSKPDSVLCPGKSHLFFRKHNLFEEKVVFCQHWTVVWRGEGSPGVPDSGRIYNLNCFNNKRYLLAHEPSCLEGPASGKI